MSVQAASENQMSSEFKAGLGIGLMGMEKWPERTRLQNKCPLYGPLEEAACERIRQKSGSSCVPVTGILVIASWTVPIAVCLGTCLPGLTSLWVDSSGA